MCSRCHLHTSCQIFDRKTFLRLWSEEAGPLPRLTICYFWKINLIWWNNNSAVFAFSFLVVATCSSSLQSSSAHQHQSNALIIPQFSLTVFHCWGSNFWHFNSLLCEVWSPWCKNKPPCVWQHLGPFRQLPNCQTITWTWGRRIDPQGLQVLIKKLHIYYVKAAFSFFCLVCIMCTLFFFYSRFN